MLRILCEDEQRDAKVRVVTGLVAMFKMLNIKGWRLLRCLQRNEPLNPKDSSVQSAGISTTRNGHLTSFAY